MRTCLKAEESFVCSKRLTCVGVTVLYVCMYIYYVTNTKKQNKCKAWKIAKLQSKGGKQASIKALHCFLSQSDRRDDKAHGAIALQLVRAPSLN